MEMEYRYLLHLTGAYLKETVPETWPEVDWKKLINLAHIHNLLGMLGYMSMCHPICPVEECRDALRQSCRDTIALCSHRTAMAEIFCGKLAASGIDHIIMKGFVLRNFFPVPELRTFGDIDLIIRPEDRQKSHDLMLQMGFGVKTDWEPVFSYCRDSEHYELHTEIMEIDVSEKADYRGYFRGLWNHAVRTGDHSYEFTPEFHFLYMLTHIAKHINGSGAGLRMYMDVAAFIRHYGNGLNWAWVRRELEKLQLLTFAGTVLCAVEAWFGISPPFACSAPDKSVLDSFTEYTLSGGIFGRNGRDSGTITLKSQKQGDGELQRADTVLRRLFPSAQTIETRYTYLQEKPWLLPAAWVHRLILTKDTWRSHMEEARNILTADGAEVQKLKQLCRKIGL